LVEVNDETANSVRSERFDTTALTERNLVHFDQTPARTVGNANVIERLRRDRDLCITAQLLGYAREALRAVSSYVTERHQFGRPIGSFQAVSQQIADCYIEVSSIDVTLRSALDELGR